MTRLLDLIISIICIILFVPVFIWLIIFIKLDSKGPIFYKQKRVGRLSKEFWLYKFRSMRLGADKEGLLTQGYVDSRITKFGMFMRKYKLDELPQLFNVLNGTMSMVGPRPEVKKYVDLYTEEQRSILSVRPGITDNASIVYCNENSILENQSDPEAYYVKYIMPDKIKINQLYISNPSIANYFRIIFNTLRAIYK